MQQSENGVPEPESDDTDDTRWALQTAGTLWQQGEYRESLRWVRRAAEAAAEAGRDDRALVLAKAGAELRGAVEIPRTLPPPPPVGVSPTISVKSAPEEEPEREGELTVTVVAADGSLPRKDASLVSHRAVRVAISAMPQDDEKFIVKPLPPGTVAPKQSTVGLLVALAPGESPLPTDD